MTPVAAQDSFSVWWDGGAVVDLCIARQRAVIQRLVSFGISTLSPLPGQRGDNKLASGSAANDAAANGSLGGAVGEFGGTG